jgi:hypothetical protein
MTATYDPTLAGDADKVRFLVGDTNVDSAQVSDEEIGGALDLAGTVYEAAAVVADALAGKYSSKTSIAISGLISVSQEQKAQAYRVLASRLRAQAASAGAGGIGSPFVGGISRSAEETVEADTDRTATRFEVGGDDFPGSEST